MMKLNGSHFYHVLKVSHKIFISISNMFANKTTSAPQADPKEYEIVRC